MPPQYFLFPNGSRIPLSSHQVFAWLRNPRMSTKIAILFHYAVSLLSGTDRRWTTKLSWPNICTFCSHIYCEEFSLEAIFITGPLMAGDQRIPNGDENPLSLF